MSCPFEEEVLLLRDGQLPAARRMVVEAHLARCDRCARIDEALELVDERLRAGPGSPLGVVERLVLRPRRRKVPLVAAAAVLAAAVWLGWPESPAPVPVAEEPLLPPDPPILPPPGPARGPAVAELVRGLDPAAPDYTEQVAKVAARVRSDGAVGSSALAALLLSENPRCALDVAVHAPSASLADPLAALLDRPEFAATAARALGAGGSTRALIAALDGPATSVAREALVSIGGRDVAVAFERRLDHAEMLDALARVDPARAARACAMGGVGGAATVLKRHRDKLVPELRRLLPDDRFAAGAARLLGEAQDRGSVDELVRLAGRPATAQAATQGLLSLGAVEAAFRAARRLPDARGAFDAARGAEPFLLEQVGRGPYADRRAALELLGRCGGEATVARLSSAPVGKSLRDAAAETLGAIGGEEAIRALDRLGRERALRRDVVKALGTTGDPRALPVLRKFAGEDGLAADLCAALARIHDARSAEMLADLALRGSAAGEAERALVAMPASVVVPVLLERLGKKGGTRDLLVRIAGTDKGPRQESWKEWWDSRP